MLGQAYKMTQLFCCTIQNKAPQIFMCSHKHDARLSYDRLDLLPSSMFSRTFPHRTTDRRLRIYATTCLWSSVFSTRNYSSDNHHLPTKPNCLTLLIMCLIRLNGPKFRKNPCINPSRQALIDWFSRIFLSSCTYVTVRNASRFDVTLCSLWFYSQE